MSPPRDLEEIRARRKEVEERMMAEQAKGNGSMRIIFESEDAYDIAMREAKAEALKGFAARIREQWAPQRCPWVGALDDEAYRIEKEID